MSKLLRSRTRTAIVASVAIAALFATSLTAIALAAPDAVAQDTVTLTLLHNNDGESKLLPNPDNGFPGIARFTNKLQELGTSTDADILLRVTSGDNFLASKEFAASLNRSDGEFYDADALSGLYEVMGLGNHDFDFGPDVTAQFIEGFNPSVPFLAANIDVSGEPALAALADAGLIAPSFVYTDSESGLDIGIIGALTPRLPNISSPRNVVVDADVSGAVNAEAERLTDDGVDRIVLVSHLQGLTEDEELVPELSGIDIVVAGGGDELLKNSGDSCMADEDAAGPYPLVLTDADGVEVPVVTAPGGYRCIGQLDVTFDGDGNVVEWSGSSIGVEVDGPAEDYAANQVEAPLAEALAELIETIIGESDVDLDGQRSSVRTGPTNVGELLAASLLAAGQAAPDFGGQAADIAIQNGGGIRNDSTIPAGDISAATTFDIAPFANFAVTTEVSRDRLKDVLEVGVSGLPDAEGVYPQIAGFTMEVDAGRAAREFDNEGDCSLTGDEGARVQTVTLDDGTEIIRDGDVVPGDPVVLATIDFLANGGDCYPLEDLEFTSVGLSYQQALASFIENDLGGSVDGDDWPIDGNNVTIVSSGSTTADDDADAGDADDADAGATDGADDTDTAGGTDETDDVQGSTDEADSSDDADLPRTGVESAIWIVVALTIAAAGAMIWLEARRASERSLATRLATTRTWIPEERDAQRRN